MICDECKKQTDELYIMTPPHLIDKPILKSIMPKHLVCSNCVLAMKSDGFINEEFIMWYSYEDEHDKTPFAIPETKSVNIKGNIIIREEWKTE